MVNPIRNQILEAVRERMADIVSPAGHIKGKQSGLLTACSLSGTYTGTGYKRIKGVLTSPTEITLTRWYEEKDPDASTVNLIASPIDLGDGNILTISPVAGIPMNIGDTVDIRFNNHYTSIRDSLRYEKTQPNRNYPYVTVSPQDEFLNKMISDRYNRDLKIIIECRLDKKQVQYEEMEVAIAEIEQEFQRSHHLFGVDKVNSLNFELCIERIQCFATEYFPEAIGFVVFCKVEYRTSEYSPMTERN